MNNKSIYKLSDEQSEVERWKTNFQYAMNWQGVLSSQLGEACEILNSLDIPDKIRYKDSITSLLVPDRVAILAQRYRDLLANYKEAQEALKRSNIGGIYADFANLCDAIEQMTKYIKEQEKQE